MSAIPATIDKERLLALFGREQAPGWSSIREGWDAAPSVFSRTGGPVCLCWAWRDEVVAALGDRAAATGYYCARSSVSRMSKVADGHDLALVDGRFLVDGWIAFVEDLGPPVLDLLDAADLARAVLIHEPFDRWTVQPDLAILGIAA